MRPRPTEVKLVVALLEGPADDVEQLALQIIGDLDEARAKREQYAAVGSHLGFVIGSGPWSTKNQAKKDLDKLGQGGAVFRLRPTLDVP